MLSKSQPWLSFLLLFVISTCPLVGRSPCPMLPLQPSRTLFTAFAHRPGSLPASAYSCRTHPSFPEDFLGQPHVPRLSWVHKAPCSDHGWDTFFRHTQGNHRVVSSVIQRHLFKNILILPAHLLPRLEPVVGSRPQKQLPHSLASLSWGVEVLVPMGLSFQLHKKFWDHGQYAVLHSSIIKLGCQSREET